MKLCAVVMGLLVASAVTFAMEQGPVFEALRPVDPRDLTSGEPVNRPKRGLLLGAGALGALGALGAVGLGAGLVGAKAGFIGGALAGKALGRSYGSYGYDYPVYSSGYGYNGYGYGSGYGYGHGYGHGYGYRPYPYYSSSYVVDPWC